jgi:GNAT superfamily N-acetyltransferase
MDSVSGPPDSAATVVAARLHDLALRFSEQIGTKILNFVLFIIEQNQAPARNDAMSAMNTTTGIRVRRVQIADIPDVIALDAKVTGLSKPEYWNDVYRRYGRRRTSERFFLVAEVAGNRSSSHVGGFIIGEVRAWEFGSEPCGWVFALSVEPESRLAGVGSGLLKAITKEFRRAGVSKMRTMVARSSQLTLVFFRSEGMMAGPYIQLEKDLD